MAQNYQMGAMMAPPPAAPANPTSVNFQSDPSMRAQFKGFMSGLSAQRSAPMQAPMQSPMNAPLPMPAPMQSVDIFQPQPMGMAMGGAVPRQAMMGGMPHMLSYITPGEAAALSAMGGTGQPGPGGVPSFVYDEAGLGFSTSSAPSMGDASYDYSGGGNNNFDVFQDSSDSFTVGPINQDYSGAGATAARNLAAEQTAARDALSDLLAAEALSQDRQKQEDLARDITARGGQVDIEEGFGPYSKVIGTSQTPMDPTEFATSNVKSIRDSVDKAAAENNLLDTVFDFDTRSYGPDTVYDIDTTYVPSPASRPDLQVQGPFQQSDITGPASRPNLVPQNIPTMTDAERNQMALDEIGPTGNTVGGYDEVGAAVGAPSVGPQFDNLGALGAASIPTGGPSASQVQAAIDAARGKGGDSYTVVSGPLSQVREEFLTKGANAPADQSFLGALVDTLRGTEYPNDKQIQQGIVDATNARTTITGDERRQDMSALDQLAKRAGQEGTGILGALTNFGARNAANMYEDIVNKGYEPIYDARGQIVATRVPGTDVLGRGSVEGRIPGANTGGGGGGSAPAPAQVIAEEIAKISNAPMASYTQTPSAPAPVQTSPAAPAGAAAPAAIPGLLRNLGFGYGSYRPVPGISANLNTAADDFLNLLSGAAPRNFAFGGSVSNDTGGYDEAGLDAFGGSGASVADITSGAKSASGQDLSFSNDDGGDNVAPTVAPGSFITNQLSQDDGYKINTPEANKLNEQAKENAAARDIAMEQQRRAAEAAQRGQNLQASIDRLNQMRQGVQAPQQGIMSGVADLLGLGSNQNLLSADLSQQGMGQQSMTPNTSVMGYGSPTGQIQTGAANQSIYQTADPSQAGIAGTANVSTQRQGSGFSLSSLPSFSQVIDRVLGPTDTYDMSRMTSR
jgi:hypothetical protein